MSIAIVSLVSRATSHLRRNWGKYLFLSTATFIGGYLAYGRYRDHLIMSELCRQACSYQARKHKVTQPLEKVFVLLNPSANRGKARKQFDRFAAPLLYLSGFDVTVVELDSETHLREVVSYLPPNTSKLLVAGGSGTLLNTVTALLRRKDTLREWDSVSIGYIPLGYRNTLRDKILSGGHRSKAEGIGGSVMAVLEGRTKPIDVIELTTQDDKKVFALSGLIWGPLVEGVIVANGYSLLGPLRGLFGFLRHAYRLSCTEEISIETKGTEFNTELSAIAISTKNGFLELKTWDKINSKRQFVKLGAKQISYTFPAQFLENSIHSVSTNLCGIKLKPIRDEDYWYHIDGEEFESFPIKIKILKNKLRFFTNKTE